MGDGQPGPAPLAAEIRAEDAGPLTVGARKSVARRAAHSAVSFARAESVLVALLGFGGLFFLYRWAIDFRRPWSPEDHLGWQGYADQSLYFREARALGNLDLIPRDIFFYGPAYPALAAPFAGIGAHGWPLEDPFLPANTAIWLLTIAATYLVGRRVGGEWVGVAAALALMLATPLARFMTLPWNSTVCLGAIAVTFLIALQPRLSSRSALLLGLAVGLAYAARYVDALWVGIIVVTIVLARESARAARVRAFAAVVAGAVVPVVLTCVLHWSAFGNPFTTPYGFHGHAGPDDFEATHIGSHALQTFVSPWFFADELTRAQPLLSSMFLLVLAPVGAWQLFRASTGGRRTIIVGYAVASAAATMFYLAYYYTGSEGLPYGSLHFLKMWFPVWTLAAVVGGATLFNRSGVVPNRAVSRPR